MKTKTPKQLAKEIARKEISKECKSTHFTSMYWDNYTVTANHIFNKLSIRLNKLLGL